MGGGGGGGGFHFVSAYVSIASDARPVKQQSKGKQLTSELRSITD